MFFPCFKISNQLEYINWFSTIYKGTFHSNDLKFDSHWIKDKKIDQAYLSLGDNIIWKLREMVVVNWSVCLPSTLIIDSSFETTFIIA